MKSFSTYLTEQQTRVAHNSDHKEISHGDSFSLKIGKEHHQNISDLEHNDRHAFKCMDGNEWTAVRIGDHIHFVHHPDDVRIHTNFHPKIPHAHFTGDEEYKDEKKPSFQGVFANGDEFVLEHIVKFGDKWKVVSKDRSKELGTYGSKEEALKRLRQIEYFKHKND